MSIYDRFIKQVLAAILSWHDLSLAIKIFYTVFYLNTQIALYKSFPDNVSYKTIERARIFFWFSEFFFQNSKPVQLEHMTLRFLAAGLWDLEIIQRQRK